MRLTTKGRFAVTAMVDVAMHATHSPVPLTEISARQGISLSYLEQLFSKLRRRALVKSARGPGGGYRLAMPMDAMTVADIIIAVDEPIDATQCGGKENCHDEHKCLTHDLWVRLNDQIFEFLRSVTLAELVEQQRAKQTHVVELHDARMSKRPQSETVPA
ncbi:MAG: Fe-S cluster assembly transcriptional regulator IscR [Burkholderiales bacterium]|nr:Fe-S cluster assembly transcriptional regulator IscR [Burkholderiales bacterium]